MRCYHCSHEIKDSAFAYKGRQECKECHSIFYWAIDIIMNNILIYLGKYEIEEIE